ncbi:PhaM family polyhydroxyalkanoate granule multifunctional regulatory protein [Bordetella bronchiseptica]|uniref:PhaM family polyhydroxyalkanoate granule multifunctional regulatory protein n=1 Tax=Bordetella bronchiseptica TaxID=518 RepID=UPI00081CB17B|nr:PhaM family polyhydroxyalkanoate granule multifunctional regulatory protein [Bordetella bronchiseptica]AOB28891.1 transcriptional regulator [Bordetella bronchiseptica]AZW46246.1 transcriptional regulator [Bordetella bronchiseptica]
MSDSHTNPFVLPGMGQNSDLSGNPLLASMEMMRQAWAGLAGPGGLTQALPMTVPMNLEDLDRRINELRSVENWLRLNLSMLSSSIQGLEVQRATIATLRSFVDSVSSAGADEATGGASPLEVALGLKPAPKGGGAPGGQSAGPGAAPAAEPGAVPPSINAAAQSASQAWWDLMQQQFNNLAAATAASMQAPAGETPPGPAGAAPAAAGKPKAARKSAAKPRAPRKRAPAKGAADKP